MSPSKTNCAFLGSKIFTFCYVSNSGLLQGYVKIMCEPTEEDVDTEKGLLQFYSCPFERLEEGFDGMCGTTKASLE